ncbi:hypothetical protein F53441_1319 [Fusarium austroafricanum]|uniref:Uncharacterized protein n=1 Tax=Fusarium austroafricanum TaxID=2364996 RepID=A0A8H4KUW1_9HYPO|nr:hypothetical protein F53441_1319 [Fusarium austroafricanum]
MSSTSIASNDSSASWFSFPDPLTALTCFNNDLTESTLPSDEAFITDDEGSDDESSIPSSCLATFPVKGFPLLYESESQSSSASSPDAQHNSSSADGVHNSDPTREETLPPTQVPKSQLSCPTLSGSSSSSDSDSDDSLLSLPASHSHDHSNSQESPQLETVAPARYEIFATELDSNLPSYHVHQIDWKHPVFAWELADRSELHNQEIKALDWDTNHTFISPHASGTTEYNTELAEWRMLRRRYIMNKPTAQQKTQSHRLLGQVAEILKRRKRCYKKRKLDSDD